MTKRNHVDSGQPLSPAVFHILLALANGERHGYDIMREVALDTLGAMRLGPGTLYGCLKRMLDAGLVKECGKRLDRELDDERRRYYRATDLGLRAVRAEAARLEGAVAAAQSKKLLGRRFDVAGAKR
ncbi:MAG TPA: PadR family transcriptional regulator [Steroidobacteraceae bacterium]|nr:PadR family transcriptional regulator [Steroidobacteraceae bacterium]